jgi:hypothetical protein
VSIDSMKKEEKVIDIYYTIKPISMFAAFCGLWPHTIKVSNSRRLFAMNSKISWQRSSPGVTTAGLLWYFLVFSIYIYVFYVNLDKSFWDIFIDVTKSDIQTYGNWTQVLSGLLIGETHEFVFCN